MSDTQLINIPFAGFYCSIHDQEIDDIRKRQAEYEVERQEEESAEPELKQYDFDSILFDCADYGAMHDYLARKFLERFTDKVSELINIPLNLTFESMISPREYNFMTDRIFAHIPESAVKAMYAAVDREALETEISERFTSRSGFISRYSNNPQEWHEKPLNEWDCNETGTLLRALIRQHADNPDIAESDVEFSVFEDMSEDFQTALDQCTDWPKFEEKVAELRAEKSEA